MVRGLSAFVSRAAAAQAPSKFLQRGFPANPSVFMCSPTPPPKSRSLATPAPVAVRWHGAAVTQRAQALLIYDLTDCECAATLPARALSRPAVSLCEFGVRLRAASLFRFLISCRCGVVFSQACSAEAPLGLALARMVAELTGTPLWKCSPPAP